MTPSRTELSLRWPTLAGVAILAAVLGGCILNPQPLPPGQPDGSIARGDAAGSFDHPDGARADANPTNNPWFEGGVPEGGTGSADGSFEEAGGDAGFGESGLEDAPAEAAGDAAVDTGSLDGGAAEGGDR